MIDTKITIDTSKITLLKDNVQKRILKKAIRKGAKLVQQAVKATAPVDTGALRQSISTKLDSVRGSTVTYGVVGPRSKFTKGTRRPGRYAHLVQKHHQFLTRAWSGRRTQYLEAVRQVIAQEMAAILTS